MLACLDVAYGSTSATAACVLAVEWTAAVPTRERTLECLTTHAYEPGQFYRRELHCLLAILDVLSQRPDIAIVDGYVWLDADRRPGLGGHLYAALGAATAVVGVAKTRYRAPRRLRSEEGAVERPSS